LSGYYWYSWTWHSILGLCGASDEYGNYSLADSQKRVSVRCCLVSTWREIPPHLLSSMHVVIQRSLRANRLFAGRSVLLGVAYCFVSSLPCVPMHPSCVFRSEHHNARTTLLHGTHPQICSTILPARCTIKYSMLFVPSSQS